MTKSRIIEHLITSSQIQDNEPKRRAGLKILPKRVIAWLSLISAAVAYTSPTEASLDYMSAGDFYLMACEGSGAIQEGGRIRMLAFTN